MEHDPHGSALAHFIEETQDRKEWGGAEQIAVFAHIHKLKVEVLGYGMDPQIFDGSDTEQDNNMIRVL
eukprot:9547564-Heterocapsa_arctica.AAC.1